MFLTYKKSDFVYIFIRINKFSSSYEVMSDLKVDEIMRQSVLKTKYFYRLLQLLKFSSFLFRISL